MPAYKVNLYPDGPTYWVGLCPRDGLLIHDPFRHGSDFGMIHLHVALDGRQLVVDRLWPKIFPSKILSNAETTKAVFAYLLFVQETVGQEISQAIVFAGQHRYKSLQPRLSDSTVKKTLAA